MDRFRHQFRVAPCVHEVPVGIIFDDDRRRLFADDLLHRRQIGPVHAEYVILSVDADAADGARHPAIRQRFRPIGVDDKAWDVAVGRVRRMVKKNRDHRNSDDARERSSDGSRQDFQRKQSNMEPDQLKHPTSSRSQPILSDDTCF